MEPPVNAKTHLDIILLGTDVDIAGAFPNRLGKYGIYQPDNRGFACHVLLVTRQGAELGHANFGPNGDLFLRAFLKVFPDDATLRHLAKEAGLPL